MPVNATFSTPSGAAPKARRIFALEPLVLMPTNTSPPALARHPGGRRPPRDTWCAPELVLSPAANPYAAVEGYCDWLRAERLAPTLAHRETPAWWREPIFCGWGEQV